jgi:DNA-binding transcriptional regulator GbsR (MarR family)
MELDSFLASPRWEILKIISERPSSPLEIAEKTKTTISFISQQLKLLEAAQLVSKEKTGAFEKGKPRNLFSISKDFFYLTILTNGFSEKKLLSLGNYQKSMLKVWSLDDLNLQSFLEDILFKIKNNFDSIDAICLKKLKEGYSIIIFSENKKINTLVQNGYGNYRKKFNLECFSHLDSIKLKLNSIKFIYQSENFLKYFKELNVSEKEESSEFQASKA